MNLDEPLDEIFATGSHVKVMRALCNLPTDMQISGREVARRAGMSHPRATQVLADLAEVGIVDMQRFPGLDLYRLNRQHVLVEQLIQLFQREPKLKFELLSTIARQLKRRKLPIVEARIFGSAARRQMTSRSDIDLALVTTREGLPLVEEAKEDLAESVHRQFGTRVNVLVGSPSLEALSRTDRAGSGVWRRIKQEGIELPGANGSRQDS